MPIGGVSDLYSFYTEPDPIQPFSFPSLKLKIIFLHLLNS